MNNFKVINDAFGHHAGDRVLVEWVKSAQLHTDQSDMIIRTGGDEFIILVRGARETDMNRILEDFQQRVSDLPASFSYGIEKIQTTLHDAIQNADQRMYAHKKNSRSTWIRRLWQRRQKKTA
jgi:diguanylate cyclase (GGDEF)-like protein